jgi:hypothetical protein
MSCSVGSPVTINFRAKNLEKAKHLGRWVILRPKTDTSATASTTAATAATATTAAAATNGDSGLNDEVCHLDSVVLQQQWLCLASRSPAAATLVSCGPTDGNGKSNANSTSNCGSNSNSSARAGQWTTAGGIDDVACTWRIHLVTLPVSNTTAQH